ncbi:hypothetical protein VTP01DRAFT_3095 [Rhizomucor pusillus]|uniref:uncharacterized protein n=1 Tax=Rhizomucor pusillus TaxID=4840 RepID=UPI0037424929
MPFINPWGSNAPPTASSATTTKSGSRQGGERDKYKQVEDILNAANYYQVLGINKNASVEEIRRAYIRRSRVCHPDKFVPPYPRATESFQLLSLAYETLSNPSSKFMYDLSKPGQYPIGGVGSPFVRTNGDHPNETLQRVLHQLFMEMMDGEFQTMRAFIHALNETNPGMHISEDAVIQIELAFRKMRELLLSTRTYYKVVQFELMRLYELQQELRRLSYFDIWRRMQLSITICKVLLQLPIMINTASREKQQQQQRKLEQDQDNDDNDDNSSSQKQQQQQQQQGILGTRVENALKLAVGLLEAGERYTGTAR